VKPLGALLAAKYPKKFPAWHREVYAKTRGLVGHRWTGFPCLLLTTVGRKSGVARSTVLTYVELDGDPVIAASNGGSSKPPAWYLNIQASPSVEVRLGRRAGRAVCEEIPPGSDDFEHAWQRLDQLRGGRYSAYQSSTDRGSALVRLRPTS
jgi:deazaflavin-dependent oxidoreductase (nitroreductase family)